MESHDNGWLESVAVFTWGLAGREGQSKASTGVGAGTQSVTAPGSGDRPRSATAETPTWWHLTEQKAL